MGSFHDALGHKAAVLTLRNLEGGLTLTLLSLKHKTIMMPRITSKCSVQSKN